MKNNLDILYDNHDDDVVEDEDGIMAIKMYRAPTIPGKIIFMTLSLGRIDRGGKIKNSHFRHSDTLFLLYFLILRQVCFLAFFDLKPPSFAKFVFSKPSFSCSCISAIQHLFFTVFSQRKLYFSL